MSGNTDQPLKEYLLLALKNVPSLLSLVSWMRLRATLFCQFIPFKVLSLYINAMAGPAPKSRKCVLYNPWSSAFFYLNSPENV